MEEPWTAARPEAAVPSAADVFEREAQRRRVIEVVLGLDDAHRDALLLRYFEGLPPRAIARRLGLPVATVKTRLKRGLAAARARLDREHDGDRRAWMALLAPVAGLAPAATLVPLSGVIAMPRACASSGSNDPSGASGPGSPKAPTCCAPSVRELARKGSSGFRVGWQRRRREERTALTIGSVAVSRRVGRDMPYVLWIRPGARSE